MREAGWNQVAADWEIFRALGTVYAARAGGRVVATAATLPYGEFAWISMVLVSGRIPPPRARHAAPEALRRGLGKTGQRAGARRDACGPADLSHARLRGFLGLSPAGATSMRRPCSAPRPPAARASGRSPTPIGRRLCAYDAARSAPTAARCCSACAAGCRRPNWSRNGRPHRGLHARPQRPQRSQIGPLVAEDDGVAQALLARALAVDRGPDLYRFRRRQDPDRRLARAMRISAQRPLTRMLLGRATGFDDTARTFAVVGPEFG